MSIEYPEWANDKQKEGMKKVHAIASEYIQPDISFKEDDSGHDDESIFYIVLDWESHSCNDKGHRHHEMQIGFDYESTWDKYGDQVHEWQFMFGNGEATREMTSEVFWLDMFLYLDKFAELADQQ